MGKSLQEEWDAAKPADSSLQSLWDSAKPTEKEAPSTLAVAGNAVAKGVAGIPDMFANAPTNLYNLGKAAVGMGAYALGQKDFGDSIEMSQPPSPAHTGLSKIGLIRPEAEPQTTGQRVLDTAIQGGIGMLASPGSAAANVAKGVVGGTAAGVTKEATGSDLAAIAAGAVVPGAANKAGQYGRDRVADAMASKNKNAVRDQTLADAQKEGYKVAPSSVNDSFVNNRLESIAGKAAIKQDLSIRNQEITNALVNRAIDVPKDTALTEGKLKAIRKDTAGPYREVAAIEELPGYRVGDKSAKELLSDMRTARFNAKALNKKFDNPDALREAAAETEKAARIEAVLERIADKHGRPGLVDELRAARTKIAKTHDVQSGLNVGDANIDAHAIGRALDNGKPLTGELETIGRFAQGPGRQVTREASKVPSPSVSGTDAGMAAVLATVGAGTGGAPGILAGGIPFLRGPVRNLVTSDFYQRHMAKPNYGQGKYLSQIPQGDAAIQSALLAAIAARQGKE